MQRQLQLQLGIAFTPRIRMSLLPHHPNIIPASLAHHTFISLHLEPFRRFRRVAPSGPPAEPLLFPGVVEHLERLERNPLRDFQSPPHQKTLQVTAPCRGQTPATNIAPETETATEVDPHPVATAPRLTSGHWPWQSSSREPPIASRTRLASTRHRPRTSDGELAEPLEPMMVLD